MRTKSLACRRPVPKASALGLNRALFYNEQEGYLETFRPYAMPGHDWVAEAGEKLGA